MVINLLLFFLIRRSTKALENGADPNYIGPEGFAAIHLAAGLDGNAGNQLLNLMLRYGGNPNLKSSDSETALHVAVMWNRESATRLLLANGADPTLRNADGLTAFDLAENTSDHELKCLDLLRNSCLDNSSESDASSNDRTCLHIPISNLRQRPHRFGLHQPSKSPKRKSDEYPDVEDGIQVDVGSQTNNAPDSNSPYSNRKTFPSGFLPFPYNPSWQPSFHGSLQVPNGSVTMSNGVCTPQISPSLEKGSQPAPRDSFFDISLHPNVKTDHYKSPRFSNMDSYNSDTQDSVDTAFTWDSDIDSSTSYFSLPKHSLKSFITELQDGEQKVLQHKGVNGEASVVIGSDFESRISLGEIPISLIKNTNEGIISDQLKKSNGRRSAEKLFLRRAKLYEMQSNRKFHRHHSSMRSSSEAPLSSPFGRRERPNFFMTPFPFINVPSQSIHQRQPFFRHGEVDQNRTMEHQQEQFKVDKTTQKYLDSSETEDRIPSIPSHNALGKDTGEKALPLPHASHTRRQVLPRQAQVVPTVIHSTSSQTIQGSADVNTRTPTTDETLSQPGNEETENEFSLIHGIGSPRVLYNDINETPNFTPMPKTLFDQNILKSNTRTGRTCDGAIFKFGNDVTDGYVNEDKSRRMVRNFSKIQRKIDVLNPGESDVFPTESESAAGESDGNSSGYSGDLSQTSSPDDVGSAKSLPMFELKNSPSITIRNKRRKGLMEGSSSNLFEKHSSTESSDVAEAEKADGMKATLPTSPRKRLNGVTSSSDDRDLPNAELGETQMDIAKLPSAPKLNAPQSPGRIIRQRIDHTFEDQSSVKSPLLPEDLKAYHKAKLDKLPNGRKQWDKQHKYDCSCELCMTKKGQTPVVASLPYCEHGQCHKGEEANFNDVTVDFDWKDVSLVDSTNTENSVVVPDEIKALTSDDLKQRLVKAGEKPGPITEGTKNIYIKHLAKVEAGLTQNRQVGDLSISYSAVPCPFLKQ